MVGNKKQMVKAGLVKAGKIFGVGIVAVAGISAGYVLKEKYHLDSLSGRVVEIVSGSLIKSKLDLLPILKEVTEIRKITPLPGQELRQAVKIRDFYNEASRIYGDKLVEGVKNMRYRPDIIKDIRCNELLKAADDIMKIGDLSYTPRASSAALRKLRRVAPECIKSMKKSSTTINITKPASNGADGTAFIHWVLDGNKSGSKFMLCFALCFLVLGLFFN